MGIILSTTFRPVSKGVLTGVREIIEGAIASTVRLPLGIIKPLSSTGLPKGFIIYLMDLPQLEHSIEHL